MRYIALLGKVSETFAQLYSVRAGFLSAAAPLAPLFYQNYKVSRNLLLALIALVVLLAACGASTPTSSGATPVVQSTTAPAQPSQAPEPTQAPQPTRPTAEPTQASQPTRPTALAQPAGQDILITLQKTGGIAGIRQSLIIYADGTVALSGIGEEKRTQAAPADIETLRKLIASPEFAAVPPQAQALGADLITYTLTVADGGTQRTIVTMDGVQNPAVLDEVLAELNKLEGQVK